MIKYELRVVTKISSCQVNTTSRRGIKQLGVSFGSPIFLLLSFESSRPPPLHDSPANYSLRKQPTHSDTTTGFPAKWRLGNGCRNSTLMTCHYPDLGSASDWLKQNFSRGTNNQRHYPTQIWVVGALLHVGCFLRLRELPLDTFDPLSNSLN